jgi:RiboL-PSP-HEPN
MTLVEITRHQQRIDKLFEMSRSLDLEFQAHWSRYICILVAGYLEVSIQVVYSEYARTKAHPNVFSYVDRKLGEVMNPNMQKVVEVARSFRPAWGLALEQDPQMRDSINSIIANRHQIAHGKSSDVTIGRLQPWYKDAVRLIDTIKGQCGI